MLKLVGDEVQSVDQFMNRYRVRMRLIITSDASTDSDGKMDHPAALQRIRVGVPATVEHSSEAGPETAKWVAETTQVGSILSCKISSLATRGLREAKTGKEGAK